MKKQKEIRNLSFDASINPDSRTICGVIPFNSLSRYIGFYERILPGAFSKTLRDDADVRMLIEHQDTRLLARTKNGSLKLEEFEDGLHFSFDAPETTEGEDILTMVRTGLVNGCSFGMIVMQENYSYENNQEVRSIIEARLLEISLVLSEPAYADTIVYTRSLSSAFEGKEIDDSGKAAIQAEIEKLQSLLPKEEPKEEVKEEVKEEIQEEIKEEVKEEEVKEPEIDQAVLDDLEARLDAAEKILCGD